ncbi:uncharacterized protein LOC142534520 [Primulina tabacum]|uniref:uncharacterized protein LOC142534520 n=1 Tax=Primulina tabacum TaxID=48773 RepID=UPI003F595DDB
MAELVWLITMTVEKALAQRPDNNPPPGEDHDAQIQEIHRSREEIEHPIKCRVFLTTLVRLSQQWFNLLRAGTIRTFQNFGRAFLHRFASSKKHPLTALSLVNVKQQEQENLRDFVKRFNKMVIDVPSATPDILICAFTQGLRGGDFFKSLVKKPPATFEELLARAEEYLNVEEVQMAKKGEPKVSAKAALDVRPTNLAPRVRRFEPHTLLGKFAAYTPLKVNKSRALELCDERRLIQRPRSSDRGTRNPMLEKYCEFHKD